MIKDSELLNMRIQEALPRIRWLKDVNIDALLTVVDGGDTYIRQNLESAVMAVQTLEKAEAILKRRVKRFGKSGAVREVTENLTVAVLRAIEELGSSASNNRIREHLKRDRNAVIQVVSELIENGTITRVGNLKSPIAYLKVAVSGGTNQ